MPVVNPATLARAADATVVMVHPSSVTDGLHVGVEFARTDGSRCFASMNWHRRLDFDAPGIATHWVDPAVDPDVLSDIRTNLILMETKLKSKEIPFAFGKGNARVSSRGGIHLGHALGLNCCTFVMVLFERVSAPLLVGETWQTMGYVRRTEDEAAQRKVVKALKKDDPEHAARVEAEVGCTRFRPEEVAAASGLDPRPVEFARAEPAGRQVLRAVRGR